MRVFILCFVLIISSSCLLHGQVKNYNFKKGEVLDVLLLIQKEGEKESSKEYFTEAIPIAKSLGYEPQPSFKVKEAPSEGNFHPQSLVFGKWRSLENRLESLSFLEKKVKDFHELRRKIWSSFNLTYYEIDEELRFQVDESRYNVALAYWKNEDDLEFFKKYRAVLERSGGSLLLDLENGTSPFGYLYNPDRFLLVSFQNERDFLRYKKMFSKMNVKGISHFNEFKID